MLFHATYEKLLPSIKEKGLVPGSRSYNEISDSPNVCFANDPEIAYSFCENAEYDEDVLESLGKIIILAVHDKLDKKNFVPDQNMIFESEDNIYTVEYKETVPPGSISLYDTQRNRLHSITTGKFMGIWDGEEENFYDILEENGYEDGLRIDYE